MSNISEANNRKLIRPSLDAVKEKVQHQKRRPQPQRSTQQKGKRATPPEHTSAENFYYLKQMQNETSMVLVLQDGEELRGVIEWYDKACLKLNRPEGRNLLPRVRLFVEYLVESFAGVDWTTIEPGWVARG